MTRLLIISFSELHTDARLQRQISAFAEDFEVITAGFGTAPQGASAHIVLPNSPTGASRRRRMLVESVLLRTRLYALLQATSPQYRRAKRLLRDVEADLVLANDIDAAPLAFTVVSADRVHVDLHEYFPGLHDDNPLWRRLRTPYNAWLVRRFASRAASSTTVGAEIAEKYRQLGLDPGVVTNASRFHELPVTPTSTPIRLVHSGAALQGRHLETMIEAVALAEADVELTLYLMPNDVDYIERLRARAAEIGPRVRIEPPVAHDRLVETLAGHDVGIHILPATSTNHRLALPNKFFDFVQARLGLIVGPTPAMASLTREHGFGAVSDGFDPKDVALVIDALTPQQVTAWKRAADSAAKELSAEGQISGWIDPIAALARRLG